jgi:hypothetical protein
MAKQNKTKETSANVDKFLDGVKPEQKRDDCRAIAKMMEEVSGQPAKMWGTSIVGFGTRHYEYESGRTGDICIIGFAPRKSNIAMYMGGIVGYHDAELKKMGKVKTGKGCIYLTKLDEIDTKVLKQLMKKSLNFSR